MRDVVRAVTGTDPSYQHTPMATHILRRMHIIVAGTHTNTHTGRMRTPTRVPMCAHAAMLIPRARTPIHHRAIMELGLLSRCLSRPSCSL